MRKAKQIPLFSVSVVSSAISALVLVACGGGANEGPATDPQASSLQDLAVTVIDGPIQNALVCLDRNDNGDCDDGEPQGHTDATGQVVLGIAPDDAGLYPVLAVVGTDAVDMDSGPVTTAYRMVAPPEHPGTVSPLTTMVVAQAEATGSSIAEAAAAVQAQTGVADAFADYAGQADAAATRSVASAIVVALQSQAAALADAEGSMDAGGAPMTAAALARAGRGAVHRVLPAIAEAAAAVMPTDGGMPAATAVAERDRQVLAAVAGAGLSAANAGLAVAALRPAAAGTTAPAPGAWLDQFRISDGANWMFRVFTVSAAESTPAADGSTRFRELRQTSQGGTVTTWAFNNDPARKGDLHWSGSHWVACTLGTQGISSALDAAGRSTSNYCDGHQISVSRRVDMDIAGKTFQEVIDLIRATPGQGAGFGDDLPGVTGGANGDESWLARTWPAGSTLRYQASTPLATAVAFDVRDSNKVSVYGVDVAAGGDARTGTPACASVTSANGASLRHLPSTLEDMMASNTGSPCLFNRGSLVNADGSRIDGGEANEWWSNSTLSLGKVGSAPLGVQPYSAYYSGNRLLRVAFSADGKASYFACQERVSDGSVRNCVAAGSGSVTVSVMGDARVMTLGGQPAGLSYERVFIERDGAVFYGYKSKLVGYETRRLNLTALNALFAAVGIPALQP